jgi:hypothetical protein
MIFLNVLRIVYTYRRSGTYLPISYLKYRIAVLAKSIRYNR